MIVNRTYYAVKPILPFGLRLALRRWRANSRRKTYAGVWPIDESAGVSKLAGSSGGGPSRLDDGVSTRIPDGVTKAPQVPAGVSGPKLKSWLNEPPPFLSCPTTVGSAVCSSESTWPVR